MAHNIVDTFVKQSILNYISIFPTRMHVLKHALLCNGTGYVWVKDSDGLLVLENELGTSRSNTSVEMTDDASGLDNLIRTWINDNIDEYCTRDFSFRFIDLRPKNVSRLISRDFNRLQEIKDMSKVHPAWVQAIDEVCEYFMTVLAQPTGHPYISRAALDALKGENREAYLILYNTHLAIQDMPSNKKSDGVEFTNKLLAKLFAEDNDGKTREQVRHDDWKAQFSDDLTFEEYNELYLWFKHYRDGYNGRGECNHYIHRHLKDVERFYTDGKLNDYFYSEVKDCLSWIGWSFFDEGSITSRVMRGLDVSPKMRDAVSKAVSEEICQIVGS